jgi:hypothetical protein
MRLLPERGLIGIGRVARIGPRLVGIRPLGRIRFADRVVEDVVRVSVPGAIFRVLARRLRKSRGRLLVLFAHT